MSSVRQGRRRNEAHRTLNRFRLTLTYPVLPVGGLDYNNPIYRVRPRGFDTVLMEIKRPAHVAVADFTAFWDAVRTMSDITAPGGGLAH